MAAAPKACTISMVMMSAFNGAGDTWTWTALDADTKLIISHFVGGRDGDCAKWFMDDVAERLATRVQLTSDGHKAYLEAVEDRDIDRHADVFAAVVLELVAPFRIGGNTRILLLEQLILGSAVGCVDVLYRLEGTVGGKEGAPRRIGPVGTDAGLQADAGEVGSPGLGQRPLILKYF